MSNTRVARILVVVLVAAVLAVSGCESAPSRQVETYRMISDEDGSFPYRGEPVVIGSKRALKQLIEGSSSAPEWSLTRLIEQAEVDWAREAVVLVPHTEPNFNKPVTISAEIESTRLTISVAGPTAEILLPMVAHYAYVFTVSKAHVDEVEIRRFQGTTDATLAPVFLPVSD